MSLIDRLRDMFTPIVPDERALTYEKIYGTGQDTAWWTSLSTAEQAVTADTIMQSAVGAALRLLADDISALPLDVYRRDGEEMTPAEMPTWLEMPTGELWDTHTDLISDSVMSLHDGNIFYLCQPSTLDIRRIEVLDPSVTTVEQDRDTGSRVYRNPDVSMSISRSSASMNRSSSRRGMLMRSQEMFIRRMLRSGRNMCTEPSSALRYAFIPSKIS